MFIQSTDVIAVLKKVIRLEYWLVVNLLTLFGIKYISINTVLPFSEIKQHHYRPHPEGLFWTFSFLSSRLFLHVFASFSPVQPSPHLPSHSHPHDFQPYNLVHENWSVLHWFVLRQNNRWQRDNPWKGLLHETWRPAKLSTEVWLSLFNMDMLL